MPGLQFLAGLSYHFLIVCCSIVYVKLLILIGINCQKAARPAGPGGKMVEGDPYGDEALAFTKERCLQREVSVWLSKDLNYCLILFHNSET